MTAVEVPPPFAVLDLMLGSMVTQTVYVAAELGIADLLHTEGPLTAEEIARKVDADLLVTGHIPSEEGYQVPNRRQLILDTLGTPACYCLFPTDRPLTQEELLAGIGTL